VIDRPGAFVQLSCHFVRSVSLHFFHPNVPGTVRARAPAAHVQQGDAAMIRPKALLAAIPALGLAGLAPWAMGNSHITNGSFDPNEWTVSPTDPTPINPNSIPRQGFGFDATTHRGGAVLYVEQSTGGAGGLQKFGTTLDLMYDYTGSPSALGAGSNASNSSVDIFFEVPSDADYAVHITGSGFSAFEKPNGTPSPENADGTLHFMDAGGNPIGPWTTLTTADLALANFHTALGFGASPNSAAQHLIAEFDLTINSGSPAGGGNPGIYDPAPAFWSASGKSGTADPPISSEIFNLQPNGGILASPVVNGNGDPVAQPSDVPEPATAGLIGISAGLLTMRRKRR
jgi:hypothetical protein